MTPVQVEVVKRSFAETLKRRGDAGRIFYDRLFAIAPKVRPMFKGNQADQERKLVDTLSIAVATLHDIPRLRAMLGDLGRHHAMLGVRREHYQPVGEALLWTLSIVLGSSFGTDAREAWTALYSAVTQMMLEPA